MKFLGNKTGEEREDAIYNELVNGNIPAFLRKPKAVKISSKGGGRKVDATIYVLPDYLAIGSDEDFIRIPMTPRIAQKFADKFGWILPTRRLVDEIYRQAEVKISPKTMKPGDQMITNDYYVRHNQMIEAQLKGKRRGMLVAGHKKDVVLTPRLETQPTKVAIYGWHQLNGKAIQPLSLFHIISYVDYSHGIRLIMRNAQVDGKSVTVDNVLKDKNLASVFSDEGVVKNPRLTKF